MIIRERLNLDEYKKLRKKYHGTAFVPIPLDVRWKAVILAMRDGKWTSIGYIQQETGFSRKRVKRILKKGLSAGIFEKTYEEAWQKPPRPRSYHSKGQGWLYRRVAYYRLRMDKISIKIKEDNIREDPEES